MSKKTADARKEFYMSFFKNEDGYEEKEVNGFWLIKQLDGNSGKWVVHLFSNESYRNYKRGQQSYKEYQEKIGFIDSI